MALRNRQHGDISDDLSRHCPLVCNTKKITFATKFFLLTPWPAVFFGIIPVICVPCLVTPQLRILHIFKAEGLVI